MNNLKVPPYSKEAEQSVIGGLMLDSTKWLDISDIVYTDDFYTDSHKQIFKAIKNLAENNIEFDVVTLSENLESSGTLEQAGGMGYLIELANNTPSAANIKAYSQIVSERSVLRKIIKIGSHFVDEAFSPNGKTTEQILNSFQDRIFELSKAENRNLTPIKDALGEFVIELDRRSQLTGTLNGLSTGFRTIDNRLMGLKGGKLIVVGGRPSQGKTSLCLNICEHIALHEKKDCLVFSMEMPTCELVEKMVANQSGVPLNDLDKAELTKSQWDDVYSGSVRLGEAVIHIDDSPTQTWQSIRVTAKKYAAQNDLGCIMIDYLQLMEGDSSSRSVNETVTAISKNLKKLSKEIDVPILLLSQLNRDLEKRPDKRPKMSDLRDSGAIEQDSDIIMFVYRDIVYNPDNKTSEGFAEIITAKFRGGKTGKDTLATELQYSRFKDSGDTAAYIPFDQTVQKTTDWKGR
jgi:replicative DNA helicase